MKKTIISLVTLILLLVVIHAKAQITYGVKVGLNLANVTTSGTLSSDIDKSIRLGYNIGGLVNYSLSDNFLIQSGILLSSKGYKVKYANKVSTATINSTGYYSPIYIEIPINALYKRDMGGFKLQLFAGPYIGIGIAGKVSTDYEVTGTLPAGYATPVNYSETIKYGNDDSEDMQKRIDLGFNVGLGIEYHKFVYSVQYGMGLTNLSISTHNSSTVRNSVIGISIGYLFGK